ncbi:MAG TPA: O-antigen ligase family protein [Chitinophagaceae bacterium]|nr:O-antigen ligase family protein [Chitinophagaceae bacterium]
MINVRQFRKQGGILTRSKLWLYEQVRLKKLNSPFGYALFLAMALVISVSIAWIGSPGCFIALGGLIGLAIVIGCLISTPFGFYFTIGYCFFVFVIKRIIFPADPPLGSASEVTIFATFLGIIIKKIAHRDKGWSHSRNPITYVYLVYLAYMGVEVMNTYGGALAGWFFVYRKFVELVLFYFIALHIFTDMKSIKYFFKFWLVMALISGLYGCWQELYGMHGFELRFLVGNPIIFILDFQGGQFRKTGTLSDPMAFGILMAVTCIFSLVLSMGPFSPRNRWLLLITAVVTGLGMAFSGTRTATAIIPAAILLFGLMTITNRKTLIFLCAFVMIGGIAMFGPFYGDATLNRMRTAFIGDKDPSMMVRDIHRKAIQPLMYSHPFGFGLATTGTMGMEYNPWNPLARFPPDSSYVRLALELGPVGLALTLFLYFLLLKVGINAYYRTRDPKTRFFAAASVAVLFAWTIAQYSQEAVGQIPGALTYYPLLAALIKLREFDKNRGNDSILAPENGLTPVL